jgi:radical SAM protein
LTTDEAQRLLRDIRRFGAPLVVFTGGDPLKRDDVVDLVAYGAGLGLRMALTPSGTPLMTPEVIRRLRDAGLARLAVSLDGSTAAIHDAFRGVAGSYAWTLDMLRAARGLGVPTQVNTTVNARNVEDFDALGALMAGLGIAMWSVFFVVPTGRARPEMMATAEQFEAVFHRMYDLAQTAPFDVKSTAAPQYRRVVIQREAARAHETGGPRPAQRGFFAPDGIERARGVTDGDGFLFVSHTGKIFPSGFLPVSAGNVRVDDLVAAYRESRLFRALRDRSRLKGKCGACEFKQVCGGSRARAYAMTGDYLEADPLCAYIPAAWTAGARHEVTVPETPHARDLAGDATEPATGPDRCPVPDRD